MGGTEQVSERVRAFVLDRFPLAKKRGVSSSDPLLESGIVDSLGILDLVAFVEKEFGFQVSDDELVPENFQTIECLATFVQKKSQARMSPR
jgi:acyl carrier protein